MLIIYTGNGKGKTSATIGQAVRAIGHNMRVAFGQFLKRPNQAGEQVILSQLLGTHFFCGGLGFFTREEDRAEHRQAALQVLSWAIEQVKRMEIILLDECLYAHLYELITQEEIQKLIDLASEHETHLILSGRSAPEWIVEQADLVTEMTEIKHPYAKGIPATMGIEF